jgi:hypothetical protein
LSEAAKLSWLGNAELGRRLLVPQDKDPKRPVVCGRDDQEGRALHPVSLPVDTAGFYCADRNSRGHYYDTSEPTFDINELIEKINLDPTAIFWG